MGIKQVVNYAVYVAVRLVVATTQAITLQAADRLSGRLAWLLTYVLRIRGKVVDENLRLAFPQLTPDERRDLTRRMWHHLLLLGVEVAHAPRKIHCTNWRHYVRLENDAVLLRNALENRPTLVTTAHFGNFEVAGYVLGLMGFRTHTVARNLDNPYLDRYVNHFRQLTGQYIIPKNGGYEQIEQVLGSGGIMTFLADQYAGPKGCWVEFFGRQASAHKAIALLAFEHNAPVVVCYARRLGGKPLTFEMVAAQVADPALGGPETANVRALTQWYTRGLEKFIRRTPDQYWWLHRRWKDTRTKRPGQQSEPGGEEKVKAA